MESTTLQALTSLFFLLFFSELAGANLKRLAPIIEAWDLQKKGLTEWTGGWEKVAVLCWAVGSSIPILAFTVACHFFVTDRNTASNFIIGAGVGGNVIALSLAFGLILLSGPVSFFRIRTMTSPVFLLLATVVFTMICLNLRIHAMEGILLLFLALAYAFYFRRFSSEWKYYERTHTHANQSLLESSEGFLPILSVFCMGIGFFVLAVLISYPGMQWLSAIATQRLSDSRLAVHIIALLLYTPWVMRIILSSDGSDSGKAVTMTNLTHSCLLNMLFIPAVVALLWTPTLAPRLLSLDLPLLLVLTGTFVATLLIEKERGQTLTLILILTYLLYTGVGVFL
jgi:Ca2+/Na+ antiporter